MAVRIGGMRTGGKGSDPGLYQGGLSDWAKGPLVTVKDPGKGGGTRTVRQADINPGYKPKVAKKTGTAGIYQVRKIPKGGNIMDMAPELSFEESLKQGSRADDPRNWEFYYKEPSGNLGATKGMTAAERRSSAFQGARMRAQREAKLAGEDVFETMRYEYEAAAIADQMRIDKELRAKKGGTGEFGSTRVARSVAQQKAMAGRQMVTQQAGRQTSAEIRGGAAGGPFSGPSRQEMARARTRAVQTRKTTG